jgi:hypothetical protein
LQQLLINTIVWFMGVAVDIASGGLLKSLGTVEDGTPRLCGYNDGSWSASPRRLLNLWLMLEWRVATDKRPIYTRGISGIELSEWLLETFKRKQPRVNLAWSSMTHQDYDSAKLGSSHE